MADVELTCPVCDKSIIVSEYADPDAVSCSTCGEKLVMPARAQTQTKRGLHMASARKPEPESEPSGDESETGQEWRFNTQTRSKAVPREKYRVGPAVRSWLIFSALACAMYFIRYRGLLPVLYESHFKTGAPFIYLAFHILITLKAFKDSVFNGILCFLLPPYALYYLFLVCDDFYLRAVFGGVLVGIGVESFLFFQSMVLKFFDAAHSFIQGGALR